MVSSFNDAFRWTDCQWADVAFMVIGPEDRGLIESGTSASQITPIWKPHRGLRRPQRSVTITRRNRAMVRAKVALRQLLPPGTV